MRWRRLIILLTSVLLLAAVTLTWVLHQRRIRVGNALVRNPPWLMWGNSQVLTIDLNSIGSATPMVAGQLVRIAYKRPENWRFLFGAELLDTNITGTAPADATVIIAFDVTTGVGRSTFTMKNFEEYGWNAANLANLRTQQHFSTSVDAGARVAKVTAANVIDHLPAQDIQVQARVLVVGATGGNFITVAVHAYFTPEVHIRPEWFKGKMGQEEDEGH